MGVTGLWKLIEPSGKPVPLETLENKVLAVDISIWIHQVIKGFQDSRGGTVPNAHLLGLFNRLCKLLYYRVKPVFVFDGGVPYLKRETIAKRSQQKNKYINESERIQQQLLNVLAKNKAIKHLLKGHVQNVSPTKQSPEKAAKANKEEEDLFKLPPMKMDDEVTEVLSDTSSGSTDDNSWTDLHTVDVESKDFKSLPLEMRHDILMDLKESRKQSSWGRLHELPEESDDFSSFQMRRLRKRRAVQMSIDEVEKEMGGHTLSISDLEKILTDEGILSAEHSSCSKRIVGDDSKKYLYIKDLKEALRKAKENNEKEALSPNKLPRIVEIHSSNEGEDTPADDASKITIENEILPTKVQNIETTTNEKILDNQLPSTSKSMKTSEVLGTEFDHDLEFAIKLSLQGEDLLDQSLFSESFNDSVVEVVNKPSNNMALARAYMLENSDLTQDEIHKIIKENNRKINNKPLRNLTRNVLLDLCTSESSQLKPSASVQNQISVTSTTQQTDIADSTSNTNESSHNKVSITTTANNGIPDVVLEVSSDSDDDFVEVSEIKYDQKSNSTKENVISAQEISSNSELEFVKVTSSNDKKIEIFIDKNKIKPDEDIFADVFENVETKGENLNANALSSDEVLIEDELNKNVSTSTKIQEKNEQKSILEESAFVPVEISQKSPNSIVENVLIGNDKSNNQIEAVKIIPYIEKTPEREAPAISITSAGINNENSGTSTKEPEKISSPLLSEQDLQNIYNDLEKQTNVLMLEKSKQDRMGNTVTEQMTAEIQELLQLFGIPYIIAPMEAEAQCAFLNDIKLTDGTITDDSDIWLFGGKTVYKNFFDQKKYVLEFRSENIYNHFRLSREQLIQFALLVGSDYTTGIQSVGPVTALEILAAFPSEDGILSGLINFKLWCQDGQPVAPGKTSLKSKLKKIVISDGFPSINVVKAYLEPTVETSKEQFRWGIPDLSILCEYTRTKFGWTTAKTEDILKPVIAKIKIKQTQKSINDFFHIRDLKIGSVDKLSKRVQLAVDKLSGKIDENAVELDAEKKTKERVPKKITKVTKKPNPKSNTQTTKVNKRLAKSLLAKEVIPQKEKDKAELLKNKMKAVEVFRKSKQGPGFVQKRKTVKQEPLSDANLSESSDE